MIVSFTIAHWFFIISSLKLLVPDLDPMCQYSLLILHDAILRLATSDYNSLKGQRTDSLCEIFQSVASPGSRHLFTELYFESLWYLIPRFDCIDLRPLFRHNSLILRSITHIEGNQILSMQPADILHRLAYNFWVTVLSVLTHKLESKPGRIHMWRWHTLFLTCERIKIWFNLFISLRLLM